MVLVKNFLFLLENLPAASCQLLGIKSNIYITYIKRHRAKYFILLNFLYSEHIFKPLSSFYLIIHYLRHRYRWKS